MNINHSYGQTSFGKAYLDPEGLEKFCKDRFRGSFASDLIEAAKVAKNSEDNDLILDENGDIYLQNAKYGKFTTCNPCWNDYKGNVFSVKIENKNGEERMMDLTMPSERAAREIDKAFGPGTYVPQARLKLFMAMEAASKYEQEQEKLKLEKAESNIDYLKNLSD